MFFVTLRKVTFDASTLPKEQRLYLFCSEKVAAMKQEGGSSPTHPFRLDGAWDNYLQKRYGHTPGRLRLTSLQNGSEEPCTELYADCVDLDTKPWCVELYSLSIAP